MEPLLFREKLQEYLNLIIREKINLEEYAQKNKITIYKNGKMDKGWKGNAVEHLLNLRKNNNNNSNSNSDYGFMEVKTVPFIYDESGNMQIKETTCLNVINTDEIINKKFEESSLYHKIKNTLFIFIDVKASPYIANSLFFDLDSYPDIKKQFGNDYSELADHIMDNITHGISQDSFFSGHIGKMIQPRPKIGKNKEYTWAFYMKKSVWNILLPNTTKIQKNKL